MTSTPDLLPGANPLSEAKPAPSASGFKLAVAVVVSLAAWGSAFAGIRAALAGYEPTHMALFRYLVASLTLAVYALAVRMPLPRWRDLPGLAVIGLIGISFYHTALNYGETVVPAASESSPSSRPAV